MRYCSIIFALSLIVSIVYAAPVTADTRYVGDQLIITLRQGKTTKHKILKTLKTGTPVEVLEENSSYLKVRTEDGTEGYVLRQYISTSPPKTHRIKELETKNSRLQNEISELENTKDSLQIQLRKIQDKYDQDISASATKSTDLEQRLAQAMEKESTTKEKYDTLASQSENVVKIANERDFLLQKNKKLSSELKTVKQENEKIADSRMIRWFLAGGGVFFFGWISSN
jgi:SH3 domain protein